MARKIIYFNIYGEELAQPKVVIERLIEAINFFTEHYNIVGKLSIESEYNFSSKTRSVSIYDDGDGDRDVPLIIPGKKSPYWELLGG